ncbi:MAG: tetratricopeptide repeat protein [Vicinamibacteraceae bacterium]
MSEGTDGFIEPHAKTVDEQRLRRVLAEYASGHVEGAVASLARESPGWSARTLARTLDRLQADIKHHLQAANRVSARHDERVIGSLRAERVQLLILFAGLHLYASNSAGSVDAAARNLDASEGAVDRLHGLRPDFKDTGAVPWPVDLNSTSDAHLSPSHDTGGAADWPIVLGYIERWYSAAVARLQAAVEVTRQPALIAKGLQRFPDSHDLLLARGSFLETHIALHRPDRSLSADLESSDDRRRWREQVSAAALAYQRASAVMPNDGEALVRLGRVQLALGRTDSARAVLTDALTRPLPTQTRYLALLFRADAAYDIGDAAAAREDYQAALLECPVATTPMLALGSLADERGDSIEAQRWVQRALTTPAGGDPWRTYIQGQAWRLQPRFEAVRTLRD